MDNNYRAKHNGIAPRAIAYLFERLKHKTEQNRVPYYIRVSYCEIYNEQVENSGENKIRFLQDFNLDS